MNAPDKEIQELSDRLDLAYERQDWGICNADAGRVAEFIQVCQADRLTQAQQYAMGELVLASMNEALVNGATLPQIIDRFKSFLTLNLHGLDQQIRYWASLTNADEFPLAGLLGRECVAPAP